MRSIIAKFRSKCAETGITLNKGDLIYWDERSRKAYHPTAKVITERPADPSVAAYETAQLERPYEDFSARNYHPSDRW